MCGFTIGIVRTPAASMVVALRTPRFPCADTNKNPDAKRPPEGGLDRGLGMEDQSLINVVNLSDHSFAVVWLRWLPNLSENLSNGTRWVGRSRSSTQISM